MHILGLERLKIHKYLNYHLNHLVIYIQNTYLIMR